MKKNTVIYTFLLLLGLLVPMALSGKAQATEAEIIDWDEEQVYVQTDYTRFRYNDRMLIDNIGASEPSYELALASVGLASDAYKKNEIRNRISDMNFTELYSSEYYENRTTYDDCDVVAFKIAEKYVRYEGKVYRIILLPVRGTPTSCEWYSDFRLGTGDDHYGFYQAADKVITELKNQFNNPTHAADETIFGRWATAAGQQ